MTSIAAALLRAPSKVGLVRYEVELALARENDQHREILFSIRLDDTPGTPIVRGIEEAIHVHEKLLLILSKDAVMSNWVQQEVEAALYKEATTGQEMLSPIRLDNTVLESDTLEDY